MRKLDWAMCVALAVLPVACNDVGDNTGTGGGVDAGGQDSTVGVEAGLSDGTQPEGSSPEASASDGTSEGATGAEASGDDVGVDEGTFDSGGADTEGPEAAGPEAAPPDAGSDSPVETGTSVEAGPDAMADATVDAMADAGPDAIVDAARDSSPGDSGHPDAADGAAAPTPCITSPCASSGPNSVLCDGNASSGVCTPTEAIFAQRDIDKGLLVNGQLEKGTLATSPNESCYECLLSSQCLNDAIGDTGQECGDVAANAPTLNSENGPQACLDVISCTLAHGCVTSNPDLPGCYCGSTAVSACVTTGPALGPCVNVETNGLNTTTPGTVNTSYNNVGLPAGMANTIFSCAFSNGCLNCLQ